MMKKWAVIAVAALVAGYAYGDFDWASGQYFYEADGSTWLGPHDSDQGIGVFVQLIRDTGADGIDGFAPSGNGVTGNDQVWAVSWFGDDGQGSAYNGQWWEPQDGKVMGATATEDEYWFYARVFDTAAITWDGLNTAVPTVGHYWDGAVWQYDDDAGDPAKVYDMTADETGYVSVDTPVAIPEPTTIILACVGLMLVRGFRRFRK